LSQNPHLTSLPAPKPNLKAPKGLTHQTGTGEIFRLDEVQKIITGDFIVLPCDLVCELGGASLAEAWMVEQGGLGGATGGIYDGVKAPIGLGGEQIGRRGGLGVWYETKTEDGVKGEETDFIALTPLSPPIVPPPRDSLRRDISNLVYTVPTDTLNDIVESKKCLPVRHQLLKKHGRIKMLTTHRDAHVYFFPYWVLEMMKRNETFESISEEVLGWWAKAGWQEGLGDKLGLRDIFQDSYNDESQMSGFGLDEEVNVAHLSSTWIGPPPGEDGDAPHSYASRVRNPGSPKTPLSPPNKKLPLPIPPILAYIQPSAPTNPLIRRVDSAQLLLSVSLRLAKLSSIEEVGLDRASPFAHKFKIAHKESIPKRCSVQAVDSLVAENVTVEEKCNIKESVIGFNCKIGEGARLLRCVIMDGAEVGANAQLSDCILGRRCRVEGGPARGDDKTVLKKCEVQEGHVVEWGTTASDEKFMRFELPSDDGMDDGDDGFSSDKPEALDDSEGISLR
jgi:translation initiation factor eIF-2B subunit gamma